MSDYDLTNIDPSLLPTISSGAQQLSNAFQATHNLTPPQAAEVVNVYLTEMSQQIMNGKQLAFVGRTSSGDTEINIIGIEIK